MILAFWKKYMNHSDNKSYSVLKTLSVPQFLPFEVGKLIGWYSSNLNRELINGKCAEMELNIFLIFTLYVHTLRNGKANQAEE